jgi:ABC-type uncharacterized transport system ATPase subunit
MQQKVQFIATVMPVWIILMKPFSDTVPVPN